MVTLSCNVVLPATGYNLQSLPAQLRSAVCTALCSIPLSTNAAQANTHASRGKQRRAVHAACTAREEVALWGDHFLVVSHTIEALWPSVRPPILMRGKSSSDPGAGTDPMTQGAIKHASASGAMAHASRHHRAYITSRY
jgi:hypothetical protein